MCLSFHSDDVTVAVVKHEMTVVFHFDDSRFDVAVIGFERMIARAVIQSLMIKGSDVGIIAVESHAEIFLHGGYHFV